jgi:hypothetical protein
MAPCRSFAAGCNALPPAGRGGGEPAEYYPLQSAITDQQVAQAPGPDWLGDHIRKAIKKRKLFPTDDAAKKVVYLAIQQASKKWTMPIREWKAALNRFMIEFEDRLTDYV